MSLMLALWAGLGGGLLPAQEGVTIDFTTDGVAPREDTELFPMPQWQGSVTAGMDYHMLENRQDPDDEFLFFGRLDFQLTGALSDFGQYVLRPRLRITQDGLVREHAEFLERDEARPLFTFREAYIEIYQDAFEISVGKQIYTWGVADGFKPNDVVNPRDHLVIPDDEKIGVPSVSVAYQNEFGTATGVFVPFFTPSRVPQFNSRWYPDPETTIEAFEAVAGFPPVFNFPARQIPANSSENFQGGVRLTSSTLIPGWDLALQYFRGIDPNGTFVVTGFFPTLDLTQQFASYHMGGGSFSTTWDRWEFHGEAAYFNTDDQTLDDDFIQYVAGVNYRWPLGGESLLEEILIIAEYAGEQTTEERTLILVLDSGVDRGLTNTGIGRVRFDFTGDIEFEVDGVYNFNEDDYYLGGTYSQTFYDDWRWEAGVNFFWGPTDSFFGVWRRNDRIFTRLTYSF